MDEETAVETAADTAAEPQAQETQATEQPAEEQKEQFIKESDWNLNPADYKGLSQEFVAGYTGIAKELGISSVQAGTMLEKAYDLIQQQDKDVVAKQAKEWQNSSRNDTEFGGRSFEANLEIAQKALNQWGGEALVNILNETGLGNHPEVIRFFYRAGKSISEDGFMRGGVSTGKQVATFDQAAAALFPTMVKR